MGRTIEIIVNEINETRETYTLYGEFSITEENGDSVADGQFTWSQESGMPAEVHYKVTGDINDLELAEVIGEAVSEMFRKTTTVKPDLTFETEV